MVIIGILAAIAIPKFGTTKDKAYSAAMKADLRNLATAEESYYFDYATYTATPPNWSTSSGVSVTIALGTEGWLATANHSGLNPAKPCYIFGGGAVGPNVLATIEGEIKCTP